MSKHNRRTEAETSNPLIDEAVVATAEALAEREGDLRREVTLSTGYRARVIPVASSLVDEVTARIPDPPVPTWVNPKNDREEPNPSDPAYLTALEETAKTRGRAAVDAMMMFGLELLDPMPDPTEWVPRLEFLGIHVDLDSPFDVRWKFLKYVAVGSADLRLVSSMAGIRARDVERYEELFRSPAGGDSHQEPRSEGGD